VVVAGLDSNPILNRLNYGIFNALIRITPSFFLVLSLDYLQRHSILSYECVKSKSLNRRRGGCDQMTELKEMLELWICQAADYSDWQPNQLAKYEAF
jgi:hypothetical protein